MGKGSKLARKEGEWSEGVVVNFLANNGEVRPSRLRENKHQDIDVHWKPPGEPFYIPVSIKVNEPEYHSHPFLFELEQGWIQGEADGSVEHHPLKPDWRLYYDQSLEKYYWIIPRLSWWYKGEAELYSIWKRDSQTSGKLYLLNKRLLQNHVNEHGWDKETETKGILRTREVSEGKVYTKLGLLSIDTVLDNKLGNVYGYISLK